MSRITTVRGRQTTRDYRRLQRLMAGAVMRPLTSAYRIDPHWTDGRPAVRVIGEFIKPNDRLSAIERLEIYNRQYWWRLLDCLREDFPGLRSILGDQRFYRFAVAYLNECPSRSFTLRNLGRRLERFLKRNPDFASSYHRQAVDMARLEWAHIEAFDNAALPPVTARDLLGRRATRLTLALQPHLRLLRLRYPVDEILISLKKQSGLRREASNAVRRSMAVGGAQSNAPVKPEEVFLAVHRYRSRVHYKRLARAQYRLLSRLDGGESIGSACESVLRSEPIAPAQLQQWFSDWAALGWFCATSSREHK